MSSGKLCVRTRLNDDGDGDDDEHTFPQVSVCVCVCISVCVRNFEMEKLSVVGSL